MLQQLFVLTLVLLFSPIKALNKGNSVQLNKYSDFLSSTYYLDDLLVVSVATNETDGYHRFVRSLNVYGYKYEVLMIVN
jgi:hypothetical protein